MHLVPSTNLFGVIGMHLLEVYKTVVTSTQAEVLFSGCTYIYWVAVGAIAV